MEEALHPLKVQDCWRLVGWIFFIIHILNISHLTVLFYILLSILLSSGSSNRELCREKFLGSVSKLSIGLLGSLISFFNCFISSLIAGFLSRQDFRAS